MVLLSGSFVIVTAALHNLLKVVCIDLVSVWAVNIKEQ